MKTTILILFLSTALHAQDFLSIGVEIAPMLHNVELENLQKNSFGPNLVVTYGSNTLSAFASFGTLSSFGFHACDRWTYARGMYTINTLKEVQTEHGAEIELGFNHAFNKMPNLKINIGAKIGMLNRGKDSKLTLRPLVIGLSYKIL